jgi:prolyl-tRNA editing enzyme YbaK/EbsC (Cys-tRNA(Pro) deacylase)
MGKDFDNPGSWLKTFRLSHPVVSCADAADAKGVALARELKTLLLVTDQGLVLAHIRGDRRLSLRAVKRLLSVNEARLADTATLIQLGVEPGTINPFHAALWELPHIISRDVLEMSWVTSNAGSLDSYAVFAPSLLLEATHTRVGEIGPA